MVKKGLIAIVVFYLLGVFGVAGGYLSSEWDGEWSLGGQLMDAIMIGVTWPQLVFDLVIGP